MTKSSFWKFSLLVCCLVVSSGTPASGAEQQNETDTHMVYGLGTSSCGMWSSNKDDATLRLPFQQWVVGFVSGIEYSRSMLKLMATLTRLGNNEKALAAQQSADLYIGVLALNKADPDGLVAWMNQYCASNPLKLIHVAAEALVLELNASAKKP